MRSTSIKPAAVSTYLGTSYRFTKANNIKSSLESLVSAYSSKLSTMLHLSSIKHGRSYFCKYIPTQKLSDLFSF
jgi:hypothetical protein